MELHPHYIWTLIVGILVALTLFSAFVASLILSLRRLKQEQDFVSSILQSTHALILVLDAEGRVIHFNKSCEEIMGLKAKKAIGHRLADLPVIGGDPNFSGPKWQTLPSRHAFDSCFVTQDGSQHIVSWTRATLNANKGGCKTILTGIDITERRMIKNALQESEARFRRLFESATVGLAIGNGDGKLIQTNTALLKILGYSEDDLRDKTLLDLISPDDQEKKIKAIREIQRGRHDHARMITRFQCKDGRCIWGAMSIVSYKDPRDTCKYSFSMIEDITAYKNAEEKLRKSRRELRKLSAHLQSVREEERTHIAREMHDELGQALSILQMDLSWLAKHLSGNEEIFMQKIQSMSDSVQKTILTVQEISRELRPSVLDNLGLVAAIEWQGREIEKRTGIRCEIVAGSDEIAVDPEIATALFRILQEGLTNVVRHSKASVVKITLRKVSHKVLLEIRDNGIGITEDEITHPDSMGLIGMKERVEFLNGDFEIHGSPGNGTTLTVTVALHTEMVSEQTT